MLYISTFRLLYFAYLNVQPVVMAVGTINMATRHLCHRFMFLAAQMKMSLLVYGVDS